ncbi:MAG: carboxypeptidase-like regulatory domain-containing protein [Terracidiphilus sp.]
MLSVCSLFLVFASHSYAQANSSVTGIITDPSGALVAGATVQLTDPATGIARSTVSDSSGLYAIAGLNAGTYIMKVAANGFESYTRKGVVVNISATFRVDVSLTVGTTSQTVTVEADALTVQTDTNVVSTLISQQQIAELATNGRNVISLATLSSGVSGNLPDTENPFSVNANYAISFNGLNQAHNIWILDGGEAYDRGSGGKMSVMPSQDALGEFNLLSSNYAPDYGLASGGAVTMSIKSGTSKLHGEAWEFDRNDALDAHNYFDNNSGQMAPKAELRYNIFGANLGGPFYIPGHYNSVRKNKTFFFYNEEWRKMVNGVATNPVNVMPADDEVTSASGFTFDIPQAYDKITQVLVPQVGDANFNAKLKGACQGGVDCVPGQPFPGNWIPGSLLDANALAFNATKNLPAATNTSTDTYTPTGGHLPINVREELFRVDHNINDKWALMGHFIHDANDSVQATPEWQGDNIPTVGSNFSNPSYMAVVKLTGSLTQNVLVEAALNYDGNKIAIIPVAAEGGNFIKPSGWGTGTYFAAANDVGNRLPDITWKTDGGADWGPGNDPWTNGAEDFAENLGLSILQGKHNFKFGAGYNRYTKNQVIGKDSEGDYTFNDAATTLLTGDSYLDFLMGFASSFSQSNANPINHYVNNNISFYGMDTWHVSQRLSLQYGFRFDALPHVWERNNQVSNFFPSLYQTGLLPIFNSDGSFASNSPGLFTNSIGTFYLNGIGIAGQNGVPRGLAKEDYKTVMPRVGFTYDLFGTGKTILRAGFGTFYERIQGNDIYDAAGGPPFISTPAATNVEFTSPTTNWQTGGTASAPTFVQGYNSLNSYYPNPGVAEYSLGIQHELAPAVILTVQYVGNESWHQNTWLPINNFPLSTSLATREAYATGTLTSAESQANDTYPGFGQLRLQENPLTGTYNSLQAGLRQENKWGLSYGIFYTWSHQIDDTQSSVDVDNNNPSYNPWNLKYDKGSGSLDRRQILNINYEYKLPFFAHAGGATHAVLGGWELAGTEITETGLPWAGNAAPGDGGADTVGLGGDYRIRPNLAGRPSYTKGKTSVGGVSGYQWVSNANFSQPVAAWNGGPNLGFGNAGKDAVVGPGRTNFSTSIYKSFTFSERAAFEFRAESFNTFNHTQFNAFNNNVSESNFGFVTGAQDPRTFELGGKITF